MPADVAGVCHLTMVHAHNVQIDLGQFHVDKPKANNADPAVLEGFVQAVADQQLLTLCDAWVLGKSGCVRAAFPTGSHVTRCALAWSGLVK